MNKYVRFLIVFIIVVVMFALTWKKDSRGVLGAYASDSVSVFANVTPTPTVVLESTDVVENTTSMRNLVLVEFFAGY
ncbi:MAG: hypothetical protein H7Y59_06780 [Anaerolineales bacterium]|nr:hypothetical protein [Anaerolineales bacterium]